MPVQLASVAQEEMAQVLQSAARQPHTRGEAVVQQEILEEQHTPTERVARAALVAAERVERPQKVMATMAQPIPEAAAVVVVMAVVGEMVGQVDRV